MRKILARSLLALAALPAMGTTSPQAITTSQVARTQVQAEDQLIILGTAGGPRPRADRGQAANLLVVRGTPYLIDAGEGTIRQIARTGIDFGLVGQIFLTHNHSDHTLGLPAILATQWEFQRREPVTILGPLGTAPLVRGMLSFLEVNSEIRSAEGFPGSLDAIVRVEEVRPGIVYRDANVTVTAVENSHYHFPSGSRPFGRHCSLAYRFDTPGRSIVFTGDTGPSAALTALAKGADILVTEVSDPDELVAFYTRNGIWGRKTPEEQRDWLKHQREEHLTPEAVAQMAREAGVKLVVLSHLPPSGIPGDDFARRADAVRKGFGGRVVVARDLDRF